VMKDRNQRREQKVAAPSDRAPKINAGYIHLIASEHPRSPNYTSGASSQAAVPTKQDSGPQDVNPVNRDYRRFFMAGASRNLAVAIFFSLTLSFNSAEGGGGGGHPARADGARVAGGAAGGVTGGVAGAVGAGASGIAAGGARGSAAISLGVGGVRGGVMVGLPRGVAPTVKVNPVTPSGPITTVGVSVGQRVIVNPSQVTPSVLDKAVSQTAPNLNTVVPIVSVSSPTPTPTLSVGNQVGSTTLSAPSVANPSQVTQTAPNVNAVVPTVSSPTLSLSVGNQVGSTTLSAPSVTNSVARGVDLNAAVPTGSSSTVGVTVGNTVLGNASGNTGLDNASGISSVARGTVGDNAAPNVNAVMPSGAPPNIGIAVDSTGQGNVYGVIAAARGPAAGGAAPSGNGDTTGTIGNSPYPPAVGKSAPVAPAAVQGIAENQTFSRSGLSTVADDGVSTKIVPARPCTSAARETDGTTSCVGIPLQRR
jgi:hypothetical protein